jgi:hypothetical protein
MNWQALVVTMEPSSVANCVIVGPVRSLVGPAGVRLLAASKLRIVRAKDIDTRAPERVKAIEGLASHTLATVEVTERVLVAPDPEFDSVRRGFCNLEPPKSPFELTSDLSSHAYPRELLVVDQTRLSLLHREMLRQALTARPLRLV